MKKILLILFLILSFKGYSQIYNNPGGVINTCSGTFYDSGGNSTNYTNNQDIITTFCSSDGNCIRISFLSFNLENNYDYLYIYDGPNTSSSLIGIYTGSNSPPTIKSTNGCLTFRFTSDYSITNSGWSAIIDCAICPIINSPDCEWLICLYDSYGDTWNNGYVSVFVNEVFIGEATLTLNYGPQCYLIPINNGDDVLIDYTPGSWSYENEFYIYNSSGELIHSEGVGGVTPNDYIILNATCSSLPVSLLYFNYECLEFLKLKWSTASEFNNDYFIIEKSKDGINFEELGYVKGAGNSNSTIEYYFKYHKKDNGYFRLKQVDFNGNYEYHQLIYIDCENNLKNITIKPNPANKNENISIIGNYSEIMVFNIIGEKVNFKIINDEIFNLQSGIYLLIIDGKTFKLIVN